MASEKAAIIKAHGKALWCKVVEPDYKFDDAGVFSTKLVITEEEKDRLEGVLQPMLDAHYDEVIKSAKNPAAAKKVVKKAAIFKASVDENGDDTGEYEISFKRKATITAKKTGKVYNQKIAVFIGKGKPMPAGVQIGNGSDITVAFEVAHSSPDMKTPGYFMQSTKEVGLSLRLQAVLVKELKEYSGDGANPFDEDEYGDDVEVEAVRATLEDEACPPDSTDF